MIFDATVSPAQQDVSVIDDHILITHTYAIPLPMNGQLVGLPIGTVRIPMAKKIAVEFAEAILEKAAELPEDTPESDLVIAKSLAGAEELARDIGQFQGQ